MSSSSSAGGGKYTRDLKLRVLEHYFRNGGDVFGNKQSTAKKFGIDSKTINRFLKIHELVRVARKNARSRKSAATSSSGGFKTPLVPGTGGSSSSRTRAPVRQTVRITLPTQPDESIVNQTASGNTSSIGKLLKIFELGTQEIRDLLAAECDLIYECRVCRGLFRSVANLLSHKRRFCTRPAADTRRVFGDGPGQSLAASSDGVLVLPLAETIDRLPEVRQAAAVEARAAAAQPLPAVRLEPLPGTGAAVFQTVGDAPSVADQVMEVHQLEAAAGRTVRLGRDGRVVEDGEEETGQQEEAEHGDDGRHVCQHCNTTFSTRKTLSHHVRSLHSSTRIYYPCCLCSAAFINMFSVERHLQKVHKKRQEEIDVLKEGIKQKSFHRSVTEAQAVTPSISPNMPKKVTSFEWKCRQCSRRYLSLPVGLQHVQSVHPQFSSARAGLVRVCRILRQPAEFGAVSTRSSSGAVTPADLESSAAAAADAEDDAGSEQAAGDGGRRMLFNKANLLRRLASGGERCVLCRKVFTGHLQACGHLRLHDQSQIEAYLGQKVRLIRKRRAPDAAAEPEEYELDPAAADSSPSENGQEQELRPEHEPEMEAEPEPEPEQQLEPKPEAEPEPRPETEPEAEPESEPEPEESEPASPADTQAEPPASVEARGFPVQMVAAERVRRRHFVHADPAGGYVCTLCETRFSRWPAVRAHMARHSRVEVWRYVSRHAVDGLVGVPASLSMRSAAQNGERDQDEYEDEEEDEDETASVDTDIEAGAKLLVSCKLWSPNKRRRAGTDNEPQRGSDGEDAVEDEEEEDEEEELDEQARDSEPLTQQLDGVTVDKWEAIRRKGSRLRCVVCNKTFMKGSYAEMHLRTDHTFEEIRDFVSNWRFKGVRVPPRSTNPAEEELEEEEEEGAGGAGGRTEPASPQPAVESQAGGRTSQKAVKRTAESAASAAPPAKVPKREQTVLNVPKVKQARQLAPVGPIGPNTKILKICRSDLLQCRDDGVRLCLVCDCRLNSHQAACEHMRQHSDEDIRNFIKTRGREFLPAFEQKSKTYVRRVSDGAGAAPPAAIGAPAKSARPPKDGAIGKAGDGGAHKSSKIESSKATLAGGEDPETPSPATQRSQRDEVVSEFELFDKAQLLKRQPDGTKCLLCMRVFAKHSSACGHLSHHGTAEVQAWRSRMRRKASTLLKLARRSEGPEPAISQQAAPTAGKAAEEESARVASSGRHRVRRKDSLPVKVTRQKKVAEPEEVSAPVEGTKHSPQMEGTRGSASSPAKASKGDASSLQAVKPESPQLTRRTIHVSAAPAISRVMGTAEPARTPPARPVSSVAPVAKPVHDDAASRAAKVAVSSPAAQKSEDTRPQLATPSSAGGSRAAFQKLAPGGTAVTLTTVAIPSPPASTARALLSPTGVSVATSGGAAQLVKLALLQSADGTLQTAGGRTIMRLAPGVKLPLAAGSLPRILRPVGPRAAALAVTAAGPVLQPPLAAAAAVSAARPRPPPLLRAPLLQTLGRAAAGGSVTVHVPAVKTGTPATAGTALAAAVSPGARPPAKPADPPARAGGAATSDDDKVETKDDMETKKTPAELRLTDGSAQDRKTDTGAPATLNEVKGEPDKASVETTKPAKRLSETKGGQAKPFPPAEPEKRVESVGRNSQRKTLAPAVKTSGEVRAGAAAATRPAVTKRAFIPELPAKPTRCSWTPAPTGKASPTDEVPQTRARAEAAIAARMRQTRRSSGATATERK